MIKHTKEPWTIDDEGDGTSNIGPDVAYTRSAANESANARRIVACVNACARIDTETLEHIQVDELVGRLRAKVDVLLVCLRAYVEIEESAAPASSSPLRERSRAAIAKAETW